MARGLLICPILRVVMGKECVRMYHMVVFTVLSLVVGDFCCYVSQGIRCNFILLHCSVEVFRCFLCFLYYFSIVWVPLWVEYYVQFLILNLLSCMGFSCGPYCGIGHVYLVLGVAVLCDACYTCRNS